MAVTVDDILKIRAGQKVDFVCNEPLEAKAGQSLVGYVKKFRFKDMPRNVVNYKTGIVGSTLTVEALECKSDSQ